MSPEASAERTSASGTFLPRLTRSSYGLPASSDVCRLGNDSSFMERPVDHVHLLLPREAHEIHGVAGHANRQAGILLGVVHRVAQHVAVQHIHVHVISGAAEE